MECIKGKRFENVETIFEECRRTLSDAYAFRKPPVTSDYVDDVASSLIPSKYEGYIGLKTAGDGNCLYNAISLLLFGM